MYPNLIIEIGGTSYSFAFTLNGNIVYKSKKYSTLKHISCDEFVDYLSLEIKQKINNLNLEFPVHICVASPGPLNVETGMIGNTPNIQFLKNTNLKAKLQSKFLKSTVDLENDCNIFSLGESVSINLPSKMVVGITLGTGLGMGIIINNQLFTGGNGRAPEYGLSPLETNRENWEKITSSHYFKQQSYHYYQKNLTAEELYERCVIGDKTSIRIYNQFGINLGSVISHIINMLDPTHIIIGGGISNASNFFLPVMIDFLKKNCVLYDETLNHIGISGNTLDSFYYGGEFLIKSKY